MMKFNFRICPRCELNYCEDGQDYCRVCLAEIDRNDNSDNIIEEKILCPICKSAYISADEDMCENCAQEKTYDDFVPSDDEKAENNWRSYIENTDTDDDNEINNDEMEEIQNIEKAGLIPDLPIEDLDENMENQFKKDYMEEFGEEDEAFEKESYQENDNEEDFDESFDDDFDDDDFDDFDDDDDDF